MSYPLEAFEQKERNRKRRAIDGISPHSLEHLVNFPVRKNFLVPIAMTLLAGCLLCPSAFPQRASSQTTSRQFVDEGVTEIPFPEFEEHFVSGSRLIHYDGPSERIPLRIVVATDGSVKSAILERDSTKWHEQALSLAKTWRYLPFQQNGRAVLATFIEDVNVVPPERRRTTDAPSFAQPFPEIKDWNSLRISLRRTRCFGTCPVYTLTISGDGSVVYNGDAYVRYCGELHGRVSREVVQQLVQMFKRADFLTALDRYAMRVTDLSTCTTSIEFDGKSKSVTDYDGIWAGMPEGILDIEDALDRLAGPSAWAKATEVNSDVHYPCHPQTTGDKNPSQMQR